MENEERLRLLAQIENMRKSHAVETAKAYERGLQDSVTPLFETADNICRSITSYSEKGIRKPEVLDGLRSTMNMLERDLAKRPFMFHRVDARPGVPFDAALMEAISMIGGGTPGFVAGEVTTGWFRNGILVRPAQVSVYG
jgi:molecular chaperone GrpE (heat shock protein)